MGTIELTLYLGIIGMAFVGALTAAYFFGFSRGAKFHTQRQVEDYLPDPIIAGAEEINNRGWLDEPSTGPIIIDVVTVGSGELVETLAIDEQGHDLVAELRAEVARQSRLRKRYLKLLRAEREMTMNNHFTRHQQYLTPYWRGWLRRRALIVDRLWVEATQGSDRIANTR